MNQLRDIPWRDSLLHEQRGDSTILTIPSSIVHKKDSVAYILNLSPTDYDTVSVYTEADIDLDSTTGQSYTDLKKLRIYYNDKFIEERDFTKNEDLLEKTVVGDIVNTFYKDVKKED